MMKVVLNIIPLAAANEPVNETSEGASKQFLFYIFNNGRLKKKIQIID